jgi:hypothetical protein
VEEKLEIGVENSIGIMFVSWPPDNHKNKNDNQI